MTYNKEAKSFIFRRGSEVSQATMCKLIEEYVAPADPGSSGLARGVF